MRQGRDRSQGRDGADGKDATYVGGQWGVVHRNVIGNGDAELGGSTVKPPMGQGALNLRTGSATDKTAFGNETDFRGTKVTDLSAIGYSVFTTGENNAIAANNMPSIAFEIDPNVTGASHFSTLVYAPDNSAPNAWTKINAKADTGKHWGLTGSFFNATSDRVRHQHRPLHVRRGAERPVGQQQRRRRRRPCSPLRSPRVATSPSPVPSTLS